MRRAWWKIGLRLIEIEEDAYLKNKAKVDGAVKAGDIGVLEKIKGADLLTTPSVTTSFGQQAKIEATRVFSYDAGASSVNLPHLVKMETRDVGVTATLTATEAAARCC